MQENFINYLFTSKTIQVLFWTLIHSLWQGIAFAFFTAIIIMSTKRSATALRYKLLTSALMLFIITSAFTFYYEIMSIVNNSTDFYKPAIAFTGASVETGDHTTNITEKLISFLQPYESFIVLIWFSIITIKCFGLLKGFRDVHVLKHTQVFNAGEYWNNRLQVLAENSGIKKQIQLLRSAIAKVPMVVGYFKPVILFPAAALTALAPEEIEAILLHELAHIRRKDYLINIFQRITEILFFFNPAVLWISSLIKEERENCCDDIAVQQTKNQKQYIHALVSFQEYNTCEYTTSFSGRKNFLLNRIKRIITNNNKTLNNMEKTFLMAGIVVTAITAFAFSQTEQLSFQNNTALQPAQIARIEIKKDTVPQTVNSMNNNDSKFTINSTMHGKQYKIVEVNGKVTELYVDNIKIPDDKISDYNDIINVLKENFEVVEKNQSEAVKAKIAVLDAQKTMSIANKIAVDSQLKANVQNMQNAELQEVIARAEMQNDSDKIQGQTEALKEQEELLQQKALAMSDTKIAISKIQLEALEAVKAETQKSLITQQLKAEKLAALENIDASSKVQAKKLKAIMKEQELIQVQNENQSKIIKDKTEKIINKQLKIQIEELKQQNEQLKQQLHLKPDSLQVIPSLPQGA